MDRKPPHPRIPLFFSPSKSCLFLLLPFYPWKKIKTSLYNLEDSQGQQKPMQDKCVYLFSCQLTVILHLACTCKNSSMTPLHQRDCLCPTKGNSIDLVQPCRTFAAESTYQKKKKSLYISRGGNKMKCLHISLRG